MKFEQISRFQPIFRIIIEFQDFDQISGFDQISENEQISRISHNLDKRSIISPNRVGARDIKMPVRESSLNTTYIQINLTRFQRCIKGKRPTCLWLTTQSTLQRATRLSEPESTTKSSAKTQSSNMDQRNTYVTFYFLKETLTPLTPGFAILSTNSFVCLKS